MKHKIVKLSYGHWVKIPWRVAVIACFILVFLAGILTSNWVGRERLIQYGLLNEYYVGQLAYARLDAEDYLAYLIRLRGPGFALTALLSCTKFGVAALLCVTMWYAFSLGFLFVNALMCMGLRGMLLVLLSLFPQIFFYGFAYLELAQGLLLRKAQREQCQKASWKNTQLFRVMLASVIMLAGIWLESYLNPMLLQSYIKQL